MAIEIERKFLVRSEAWRDQAVASIPMRQAYLGGERCSVRVRIAGDAAWINLKSRDAGILRLEYEYPIPRTDAAEIVERLAGSAVVKVRHHVPVGGVLFEVDVFDGDNAGLVLAEVELPAVDAAFPRPSWLGEEVSDDPRYTNLSLAEYPYCRWRQ